jgi:quinol monooxygenase YgiN
MVRLNVALRSASTRAASDLLETLRVLMATTRFEPGCQECTASMDADFTVRYAEIWATEADLRRRVRSSAFTSLLALMECASAPPDVEFDFVATRRRLDFVAEVREIPVIEPGMRPN